MTLGQKLEPFKNYTSLFIDDVERIAKNTAGAVAVGAVLSGTVRSILHTTGSSLTKSILLAAKYSTKNLLLSALIFSVITNGGVLAQHKILVPENNENLPDWFRDILHLPEISEFCQKNGIDDEILKKAV